MSHIVTLYWVKENIYSLHNISPKKPLPVVNFGRYRLTFKFHCISDMYAKTGF